jgi:hypothetical protein
MQNGEKTKKELLIELISLRKRIAELETLELQHKQNEEALLRNNELLLHRLHGYDEFYAVSTSKDLMILELKEQLERLRLGLGN